MRSGGGRPEFDSYCTSPAWQEFARLMDNTLKKAQSRWDAKFGEGEKSYFSKAIDTVRWIISPRNETTISNNQKRKANDQAGGSSKIVKTESKRI